MARKSTQKEIRDSILDLRRIWSDLTDDAFIKMYHKKYRVPISSIKEVLEQD